MLIDHHRIVQAFLFAFNAHFGIFRKDGHTPSIVHPMDVASTLMKNGTTENVIIAGLLHDVLEDAGVTFHELNELFGEKVAILVEGASEPEKYRGEKSRETKRATWRERKTHTINRMKDAEHELKLLTCADKLANLRDTINDYRERGDNVWTELNSTREDNEWYYRSILASFESTPNSLNSLPILNQFRNSIENLSGLS